MRSISDWVSSAASSFVIKEMTFVRRLLQKVYVQRYLVTSFSQAILCVICLDYVLTKHALEVCIVQVCIVQVCIVQVFIQSMCYIFLHVSLS